MIFSQIFQLAIAALAIAGVLGHLDLSPEDMVEYHLRVARGAEALSNCLKSPEMQEINKRVAAERLETFSCLRKARDTTVEPRAYHPDHDALVKWAQVNHSEAFKTTDPQDLFGFKWDDDPKAVPAGCILTPENVYGPFWHEGQLERQDIRGGQDGVRLRLALQVIDVATCMPMHGARVDAWHANPVGDYSATNTSWLRGWQPTSRWGTVDFETVWPGHYYGRATHVHVSVRSFGEKRVVHSGQIFFDEEPRVEIEKFDPFTPFSSSDESDPFAKYTWFSNDKHDGILAWTTVGVNLSDPTIEQPPNQKRRFIDDHLEY